MITKKNERSGMLMCNIHGDSACTMEGREGTEKLLLLSSETLFKTNEVKLTSSSNEEKSRLCG